MNESFPGEEVELLVKKDGALLDLKRGFEKQEGIEPARQRFFCGPIELEDDHLPLAGLLELNNNTLDVLIPEAADPDPEVEVQAEQDVWIVFGPSRNVFERIRLAADATRPLTLKKGKLGIVTLTNVDAEGRNVYTVDRYKFREEEIKIVLKVKDGRTVVYKKITDDQEVLLTVQKSVVYKDITRYERGVEKARVVGEVLGNIGKFFGGVASFAGFRKLKLAKVNSYIYFLQSRIVFEL